MKRLNYVFFPLLAALLTACGGNTYYLSTNDARGLESGDLVYRQGIAVGEVAAVAFDDNLVKITVELDEELYEDQGFSIQRQDGETSVSLSRPDRDANALANGASLRRRGLDGDLFGGLEQLGTALEEAFEESFGPDGEKLERALEGLGESLEGLGDNWDEALEEWGNEHEDEFADLERKLLRWADENEAEFKAFERELDEWAEDFDGDVRDVARAMERAAEEHPVGSKAWKKALRRKLEK
ncbi:MAG: MlaD family protein [Bacteroidota bacterium]